MTLAVEAKSGNVRHINGVVPIAKDRVPSRREAMNAYAVIARRVHDAEALKALDVLWAAITAHVPNLNLDME